MRDDKTPVRIRTKEITGGRKSIYLDIYQEGKRTYEFLRLYLLPPTSRANKDKNKETMMLAEAVRAKRIVEIRNGKFGFHDGRDGGRIRLLDYFRTVAGEKRTGNKRMWLGCLNHLADYERRSTFCVADITPKWLEGFQRYLLTEAKHSKTGERIAQNTACTYYHKLVAMLNQAVREGIIERSPADKVKNMTEEDTEREYLTIDEVRILAEHMEGQGRCAAHLTTKHAFLFSCLTGLRKSDILNLTWGDVEDTEEGAHIVFRQKKTHGLEYMYISAQARSLMGERKDDVDHVFQLKFTHYTNFVILRWVNMCGIRKHITFHSARHTFATMMLTLGNDIYTTSKLLGHRSVRTTQIYAMIVDEKRKKAVESIPDLLPENL